MRYIKEGPFLNLKGKQVLMGDKEQTSGSILRMILEGYQPDQRFTIAPAEQHRVNKVADILEKPPFKSGYFAIEDADFETAQKVILFMLPKIGSPLTQLTPSIADILEKAAETKKEPELVEESPNGEVKEPEKVLA